MVVVLVFDPEPLFRVEAASDSKKNRNGDGRRFCVKMPFGAKVRPKYVFEKDSDFYEVQHQHKIMDRYYLESDERLLSIFDNHYLYHLKEVRSNLVKNLIKNEQNLFELYKKQTSAQLVCEFKHLFRMFSFCFSYLYSELKRIRPDIANLMNTIQFMTSSKEIYDLCQRKHYRFQMKLEYYIKSCAIIFHGYDKQDLMENLTKFWRDLSCVDFLKVPHPLSNRADWLKISNIMYQEMNKNFRNFYFIQLKLVFPLFVHDSVRKQVTKNWYKRYYVFPRVPDEEKLSCLNLIEYYLYLEDDKFFNMINEYFDKKFNVKTQLKSYIHNICIYSCALELLPEDAKAYAIGLLKELTDKQLVVKQQVKHGKIYYEFIPFLEYQKYLIKLPRTNNSNAVRDHNRFISIINELDYFCFSKFHYLIEHVEKYFFLEGVGNAARNEIVVSRIKQLHNYYSSDFNFAQEFELCLLNESLFIQEVFLKIIDLYEGITIEPYSILKEIKRKFRNC